MTDELVCMDCGDLNCTQHLKWITDGLGAWWQQCRKGCDIMVVRPGKVQCSCHEEIG
jgi:hypothetical protein